MGATFATCACAPSTGSISSGRSRRSERRHGDAVIVAPAKAGAQSPTSRSALSRRSGNGPSRLRRTCRTSPWPPRSRRRACPRRRPCAHPRTSLPPPGRLSRPSCSPWRPPSRAFPRPWLASRRRTCRFGLVVALLLRNGIVGLGLRGRHVVAVLLGRLVVGLELRLRDLLATLGFGDADVLGVAGERSAVRLGRLVVRRDAVLAGLVIVLGDASEPGTATRQRNRDDSHPV